MVHREHTNISNYFIINGLRHVIVGFL